MAKGIALSPINCGYLDDKGKNVTKIFGVGDKVDVPDEVFADLLAAKAVAAEPKAGDKPTPA
jgi:hypothetical protein